MKVYEGMVQKVVVKSRSSFPIYVFLRPALLWATAQTIMNQKSERKIISFAKKIFRKRYGPSLENKEQQGD